jgi:hypothetical protein
VRNKFIRVIVFVGLSLSMVAALTLAAQDKYAVRSREGSHSRRSGDTKLGRPSP